MTHDKAIARAKRVAAKTGYPQTVWRYLDTFDVTPEGANPLKHPAFTDAKAPVRPVAVYDPDGTEHC